MNTKIIGLRLAATIFGIIAILHLLRLITGISVLIGGWMMPMWFNLMGLIGAAGLCIWLLLISSRMDK